MEDQPHISSADAIAQIGGIDDDPSAMASERIIVVDDDTDLRGLVADYLRQSGFAVREAGDGAMLRALLDEETADLVLLDIMMPGEDGLAVLRSLTTRPDVAVIMLSTLANDVDRIVGLELGADDYLAKPCNPRELLARVRAVLRRRQPRTGEAQPGDGTPAWCIDTKGWRLSSPAGEDVPLSTGEMRVLIALAEAKGRVLTRDQLLDRCAIGEDSVDRAIDVHVSRLRKKLEPHGGDALVRTVRGEGYSLGGTVTLL